MFSSLPCFCTFTGPSLLEWSFTETSPPSGCSNLRVLTWWVTHVHYHQQLDAVNKNVPKSKIAFKICIRINKGMGSSCIRVGACHFSFWWEDVLTQTVAIFCRTGFQKLSCLIGVLEIVASLLKPAVNAIVLMLLTIPMAFTLYLHVFSKR